MSSPTFILFQEKNRTQRPTPSRSCRSRESVIESKIVHQLYTTNPLKWFLALLRNSKCLYRNTRSQSCKEIYKCNFELSQRENQYGGVNLHPFFQILVLTANSRPETWTCDFPKAAVQSKRSTEYVTRRVLFNPEVRSNIGNGAWVQSTWRNPGDLMEPTKVSPHGTHLFKNIPMIPSPPWDPA